MECFPTSFKKKKKIPFLKERFSACVMIHCTFCAVHSGAVDSKGHQGVLLGKRWFLSLPREQSNSSGCHFRASWNNLQFIAAVVIALNWSWNGGKKWFPEQLTGIVFAFLTIYGLVLQLEMSRHPSQNGKTCLCICWGLVCRGEMELKWNTGNSYYKWASRLWLRCLKSSELLFHRPRLNKI